MYTMSQVSFRVGRICKASPIMDSTLSSTPASARFFLMRKESSPFDSNVTNLLAGDFFKPRARQIALKPVKVPNSRICSASIIEARKVRNAPWTLPLNICGAMVCRCVDRSTSSKTGSSTLLYESVYFCISGSIMSFLPDWMDDYGGEYNGCAYIE